MSSQRLILIFVLFFLGLVGCSTSTSSKKSIYAQYERAIDAYNEGRFSDAEPMLRKLLLEHPQFAEGWFRLGNLYVRTGQNEAAITAFKTCLRYDNDNTKAWHNLSLVHLKMGIAALDEGIARTVPDTPDYNQLFILKKAMIGVSSDTARVNKNTD